MARYRPNIEDAKASLVDHVFDCAARARQQYGPDIDLQAIAAMLEDPTVVRYPTTLVYDSRKLINDEFAFVEALGDHPVSGFRINLHQKFSTRSDLVPLLVAYHLVVVNYGEIATHEEAEVFGATLLGLDREDYYQRLCRIADELADGGRREGCITEHA